ncbi:MAG TPA: TIGR01777 family oxidoreductase [Ktedonobacteraceae bacterium]|nr:TIGR01777 family oxidoreductase [Ktedonobacteraceae bacterium]
MSDEKRIVVAGATGLIGRALSKRLIEKGYALVVFSRDPDAAQKSIPGAAEYVAWQPELTGQWTSAIEGAYGVVNLAGAPFFTKWTEEYKRQVHDSRLYGTKGLIQAMKDARVKPRVFVYGSSVGYYGYEDADKNAKIDEYTPAGKDFCGQDSEELEQEAREAEQIGVRTVLLRTGIVLDARGGALPGQAGQFRRFFGGYVRPGNQWYPWIHIDDEVGLILWALENEQVRGPVNGTAPEPQTNRDFAATLGKVLNRPSWMPLPGSLLKLFLGEVSVTITHGRRVVPNKAQSLGYEFQYSKSEQAIRQLLNRKTSG